ncbi:hypothetical protein MXB_424 [Myxobolus squamalis]|nr:hypothetical protein MXB_424 [Myxobolus squamalis]
MTKEKETYTDKKLRKIILSKPVDASYGFSIVLDDGIGRYTVKNVIKDSISEQNGIKVGDIVYEINDFLLDQLNLQEILGLLQNSKQQLTLTVVSKMLGVDQKSFITKVNKNKKFYQINSERIDISNEKGSQEKKEKFCLLRRMSMTNRTRDEHKYSIPISPPPRENTNRTECDLSSSECSCQGIPSSNSCDVIFLSKTSNTVHLEMVLNQFFNIASISDEVIPELSDETPVKNIPLNTLI